MIMAKQNDKVVLKFFDAGNSGTPKRPHNCAICQAYKREMVKGNLDAMKFYKSHINEFVKKYGGATIVLPMNKKKAALPSDKSN